MNIETWGSEFISSILSGGETKEYMNKFEVLLNEYIEKGEISEIHDKSNYFANDFCRSLTESFTHVQRLAESDLLIMISNIQRTIKLFTTAYCSGKEIFSDYILMLYDYDSNFFEKNDIIVNYSSTYRTKELFTQFVKFFTDGPLNELEKYFIEKPTFQCFTFCSKLLKSFKNCADEKRIKCFIKTTNNALIKMLEEFKTMNIREIDNQVLSTVLQTTANWFDASNKVLLACETCLRSGFLEKQITGAKVIAKIAEKEETKDAFLQWAQKANFGQFLTSGDIHQDLLSILSPTYVLYFNKYHISNDLLSTIWQRAKNSHTTLKEPFFKLIANILSDDPERTASFVADIKSRQIDRESILFLITILGCWKNESTEIPIQVISFCLNLMNDESTKQIGEEFTEQIGKSGLFKFSQIVLDFLIHSIKNGTNNWECVAKLASSMLLYNKQKIIIDTVFEEMCKGREDVAIVFKNLNLNNAPESVEKYLGKAIPIIFKTNTFSTLTKIDAHSLKKVTNGFIEANIDALLTCDLSKSTIDTASFAYGLGCSLCHSSGFYSYTKNLVFNLKAFLPLIEIAEKAPEFTSEFATEHIIKLAENCKEKSYSKLFEFLAQRLNSKRMIKILEKLIDKASYSPGQPPFTIHAAIRDDICNVMINNVLIEADRSLTINDVALKYQHITGTIPSLTYCKEQIDKTLTINQLGFEDNVTLELSGAGAVIRAAKEKENNSIATLLDCGIRDKLYENLDNEELCEESYKAIIILPSINTDNLLEELQNDKGYKLRYWLHAAFRNPSVEATNIIQKQIADGNIKGFGITEACEAIMAAENFTKETNNALIDAIFDTLSERIRYDKVLIKCAIAAINAFPETVSSESIEKIITKRFDIISQLTESFLLIPNKASLFESLVHKAEQSNKESDFQILTAFVDSTCDVKEALKMIKNKAQGNNAACDLFVAIVTTHEDLKDEELRDAFTAVLDQLPSKETCEAVKIMYKRDAFKQQIREKVLSLCDVKTDKWSYEATTNTSSSTGLVGLRNLGATCYMNSVFQALFNNVEFRNALLSYKTDDEKTNEWLIELQKIFFRMEYTSLPYVDTSNFAKKWCFYGSTPMNPREQQDAVEFLTILLDRLQNGPGNLYKGIQVTKMEAENQVINENEEPFFALSLEVKGCTTVADSFSVFLQREMIEGYNSEKLGRKVDVERYTRIRKNPEYLVIQLKRFDYDLTTFRKIKVNGKFNVPFGLNIEPIAEESADYVLQGAVVHAGTADGGHYTALMKYGNDWVKFNDNTVTCVTLDAFQKEVNGKEESTTSSSHSIYKDDYDYDFADSFETHEPSGYLLFYSKKDREIDQKQSKCPEEIKKEIDNENEEFLKMQKAFSQELFNLFNTLDDAEIFKKYFFNVFVHRKQKTVPTNIVEKFMKLLPDFEIIEYKDEIFKILTECQDTNVVTVVQSITTNLISDEFAEFVFSKLQEVEKNWRSLPSLIFIILSLNAKDHDTFVQKKYPLRLLEYCAESFARSRSSIYVQNADYSDLANIFNENEELVTEDVLAILVAYGSYFVQSTFHAQQFIQIVQTAAKQGKVAIDDFIQSIINESKDPSSQALRSLFISTITNCTTKEEAWRIGSLFLFSSKVSKESLVNGLRDNITDIGSFETRKAFLTLGGKILFYLATCDDAASRGAMEPCYLRFFKSVDGLSGYGRAELILTSKQEVDICWTESREKKISKEERPLMEECLRDIIKGFEEIAKNPTETIKGRDANIRLLIQLRVMIFMVLRTETMDFHGYEVLVDLAKSISSLHVHNDLNVVEIGRVFFSCDERASKLLIPRYKELVDSLFESEADENVQAARFTTIIWALISISTEDNLRYLFTIEKAKAALITAIQKDGIAIKALKTMAEKKPELIPVLREELSKDEFKIPLFVTFGRRSSSLIHVLGIEAPTSFSTDIFRKTLSCIANIDLTKPVAQLNAAIGPKIIYIKGKTFDITDSDIKDYQTAINKAFISLDETLLENIRIFLAFLTTNKVLYNIFMPVVNEAIQSADSMKFKSEFISAKTVALLNNKDAKEERLAIGEDIKAVALESCSNYAVSTTSFYTLIKLMIALDGYEYHRNWISTFANILSTAQFWFADTKDFFKFITPFLDDDELTALICSIAFTLTQKDDKLERLSVILLAVPRSEEMIISLSGMDIDEIKKFKQEDDDLSDVFSSTWTS